MTSEFRSRLDTELADGSDTRFVLLSPLRYYSDALGYEVLVPAGFETDFASVPRIPFAYMLFGGVAKRAAVVHDWLYSTRGVARALADRVFLEAMEISGIPWWRRRLMYRAVRLFGGPIYAT